MQCEAALVEEEHSFVSLEEVIAVSIHLHPKVVKLGRVHVVCESTEVPEQHSERYLVLGGLVLRDLLLSRQSRLSQLTRLVSEASARIN